MGIKKNLLWTRKTEEVEFEQSPAGQLVSACTESRDFQRKEMAGTERTGRIRSVCQHRKLDEEEDVHPLPSTIFPSVSLLTLLPSYNFLLNFDLRVRRGS